VAEEVQTVTKQDEGVRTEVIHNGKVYNAGSEAREGTPEEGNLIKVAQDGLQEQSSDDPQMETNGEVKEEQQIREHAIAEQRAGDSSLSQQTDRDLSGDKQTKNQQEVLQNETWQTKNKLEDEVNVETRTDMAVTSSNNGEAEDKKRSSDDMDGVGATRIVRPKTSPEPPSDESTPKENFEKWLRHWQELAEDEQSRDAIEINRFAIALGQANAAICSVSEVIEDALGQPMYGLVDSSSVIDLDIVDRPLNPKTIKKAARPKLPVIIPYNFGITNRIHTITIVLEPGDPSASSGSTNAEHKMRILDSQPEYISRRKHDLPRLIKEAAEALKWYRSSPDENVNLSFSRERGEPWILQFVARQTRRDICGLHTILNGWAYAMNLHVCVSQSWRASEQDYDEAQDVINLALKGRANDRLIYWFLRSVGFLRAAPFEWYKFERTKCIEDMSTITKWVDAELEKEVSEFNVRESENSLESGHQVKSEDLGKQRAILASYGL
jgi:hypothetical protein